MRMDFITNGCIKCAIYPFNPSATDKTKLTPSLIPTPSIQLESALNQPSPNNETSIGNSEKLKTLKDLFLLRSYVALDNDFE